MTDKRKEMIININNEKKTIKLFEKYSIVLKSNITVSNTSEIGGDEFIANVIGIGLRKKTITFRTSMSQPYFTISARDIASIEEWTG